MTQLTIELAFQRAVEHHQAGQLPEAEALYRQILAEQPNHAEAVHLLGVIAHQLGQNETAVNLIRQAIALKPTLPEAQSNLGEALRGLGSLEESIGAFRRAIELKPNFPAAHNNLGNVLAAKGHVAEAIAAYREAVRLRPDYPEAQRNLGNALCGKGDFSSAVASYRTLVTLAPMQADAHNLLGRALMKSGKTSAAILCYRQALALNPEYTEARLNLGSALKSLGQPEEAVLAYQQVIAREPDNFDAHNNLGTALRAMGRREEALAALRQAIALRPNFTEAYGNLGNTFKDLGRLDDAIAAYRQALVLQPNLPDPYGSLGNIFKDLGRLDEAIAAYRQALAFRPDFPAAHANLLYLLHYHPDYDSHAIAAEHRRWHEQHAAPLGAPAPWTNPRVPGRRLRIGYVSPDFYGQAESFFVMPLFAQHDHGIFEIHAYASVLRPDEITDRLQQHVDQWHDVSGSTEAQLAEQIRADEIDILVDLTMHMGNNRILLFARKPAPVQVTWLAYPGSSGLPAIDHRLTDGYLEPRESDTSYSAERLERLPDSWCCFDPLFAAPECGPLPALAAGFVTFASLNNPCKHTEPVVRLWARVLQRVDHARLLLLCAQGSPRERMLELFAREGISAARIEFVGSQPRIEYLRTYDRIDIALDPLSYNGHTTTCDALWMGVPVLTRPGQTPAARLGLSLLANAGLTEFVATSDEKFVELAAEMARDLDSLARRRAGLRAHVQASRLMDAQRFARNVEAAYRRMWRTWCDRKSE
ncbi:MAG: tetratricopeptide repeat protein [Opitutus sp.]|nr:tetratricopeptide repeat protein [Opitutus sp.]